MKFCKYCGSPVASDTRICSGCGKMMSASQNAPARPSMSFGHKEEAPATSVPSFKYEEEVSIPTLEIEETPVVSAISFEDETEAPVPALEVDGDVPAASIEEEEDAPIASIEEKIDSPTNSIEEEAPVALVEEEEVPATLVEEEIPTLAIAEEEEDIPTVIAEDDNSVASVNSFKYEEETPAPVSQAPQTQAWETPAQTAPSAPSQKKMSMVRKWLPLVCNSLLVVIAFLFVILSFSPVLTMEIDIPIPADPDEVLEYEYHISVGDAIAFLKDCSEELDEDDIPDSDLVEDYLDFVEEMYDWDPDDYEDYDDLTSREKKDIDAYLTTAYRLHLQHEDTSAPANLIISVVLGILYIALCFIFLIVAVLNLLTSLNILQLKKSLYHKALGLLCAVPMFMLAVHYSMYYTFNGNIVADDFALGNGSLTAFVLAMIVVVILTAIRLALDKGALRSFRFIRAALAVTAVILVISCTFLPIMSSTLEARFGGKRSEKEATMFVEPSFFAGFELNDSELNEYRTYRRYTKEEKKAYFELMISNISANKLDDVEDTLGETLNNTLLTKLIVIKGEKDVIPYLALVPLLYLITCWGALAVLGCVCYGIVSGKHARGAAVTGKCLAIIGAIAFLTVMIVFYYILDDLTTTYFTKKYTLSFETGAIWVCVLSLVLCCIPCKMSKEKNGNKSGTQENTHAEPVSEAPFETPVLPFN